MKSKASTQSRRKSKEGTVSKKSPNFSTSDSVLGTSTSPSSQKGATTNSNTLNPATTAWVLGNSYDMGKFPVWSRILMDSMIILSSFVFRERCRFLLSTLCILFAILLSTRFSRFTSISSHKRCGLGMHATMCTDVVGAYIEPFGDGS